LLQNLDLIEADAQQAYDEISERLADVDVEVMLLHGRFNQRDRQTKEQLVQDCTGVKGYKQKPVVLVATQVVEVSLDIDLDTIYTEPVPLEALCSVLGVSTAP
jgi:CRISPR-associated endonuclease/helicase Cas3